MNGPRPLRSLVANAILAPSGDHAGSFSLRRPSTDPGIGVLVMLVCPVPSAFIVQMSQSSRGDRVTSVQVHRLNAIFPFAPGKAPCAGAATASAASKTTQAMVRRAPTDSPLLDESEATAPESAGQFVPFSSFPAEHPIF